MSRHSIRIFHLRDKKIPVYTALHTIPSGSAPDEVTEGCLVLEGGAFRGLYSQGVMDALMQSALNFTCVIGVSAGAMGGLNYASGQIGRSARVNLGFRKFSDYVGARAMLHAHSIIRLDFALRDYNEVEPLDLERFRDPRRRYVAVATNCLTAQPVYFEKDTCGDILEAVKASASMPFISPMVQVDGIPCLDGACSCAIPFQWALDQGYRNIIVVRTRDRSYRKAAKEPKNPSRPQRWYRKYPQLGQALAHSDLRYNEQCSRLEQLEQEGRIFVIAPEKPVEVNRVERNLEKLGELYWEGCHDMMNRKEALLEYLARP